MVHTTMLLLIVLPRVMLRILVQVFMASAMMDSVMGWLLMVVFMTLVQVYLMMNRLLLFNLMNFLRIHVMMDTDRGRHSLFLAKLHIVRILYLVMALVVLPMMRLNMVMLMLFLMNDIVMVPCLILARMVLAVRGTLIMISVSMAKLMVVVD